MKNGYVNFVFAKIYAARTNFPETIIDSGRTLETTTATTTPPLDGATEPEASSLKLDGNGDPEFCG